MPTIANVDRWITELAKLGGEDSPDDFSRSQSVVDTARLSLGEHDGLSERELAAVRRLAKAVDEAERQLDRRRQDWLDAMASGAMKKTGG